MLLLILALICFWFVLKKDSNDEIDEFNLGVKFLKGDNVPQNYDQAFIHFQKAANLGSSEAQYNLGSMYLNGYGVPQDDNKAASWFQASANQGFLRAQSQIGAMMCEGLGVPKDVKRGRDLILRSAAQGDDLGLKYCEIYHDLFESLLYEQSTPPRREQSYRYKLEEDNEGYHPYCEGLRDGVYRGPDGIYYDDDGNSVDEDYAFDREDY